MYYRAKLVLFLSIIASQFSHCRWLLSSPLLPHTLANFAKFGSITGETTPMQPSLGAYGPLFSPWKGVAKCAAPVLHSPNLDAFVSSPPDPHPHPHPQEISSPVPFN